MKDLSKTVLKVKPTKAYVDEKLERLDKLIDEAPDDATKASYQNYKDFWIGQLSTRSVNARKKKDKLENELIEAEKKAEEDAILEEITQRKAQEAKDAEKAAIRLKADKAALANDRAAADLREAQAQELLIKIQQLEAQIKIKKKEEEVIAEIEESESESAAND